jgi:hypothetical protein
MDTDKKKMYTRWSFMAPFAGVLAIAIMAVRDRDLPLGILALIILTVSILVFGRHL